MVYLGLSYTVAGSYRFVLSNLEPLCTIPFLGPRIPLCQIVTGYDRQINVNKLTDSQEALTQVMGHVGPSFEVATSMVRHEFAIRDLRLRVSTSSLSRAPELAKELEALSRYTKLTSK
jgi:hypothetical protein